MSGYTPLFTSVLDGTLYGKWPHTGIWMCLLSQCDRNGNIDMVPGLLAAKIGVTVELLTECITDFMKPDPGSRTGDLEGRRLELMEPASRGWGWRVVNHSLYRERARKQAYDSKRTASGKDAERKQQLRDSREVPTRPAKSRSQTHTQTQTKTQTKTEEAEAPAGLDVAAWQRWVEYRRERKPPIKAMSVLAAMREMAALGDQQAAAVEHTIANGWQGLIAPKANGGGNWQAKPTRRPKTVAELEAEEASRAQH